MKSIAKSPTAWSYAKAQADNTTDLLTHAFDYDATNRHSQTTVTQDGEASRITYLRNAAGQRVFKS